MISNSGYTAKRIYFLTSYIWVEEKIIKAICKQFPSVLQNGVNPLHGKFLVDFENLHKNLLLKISDLLRTDFNFFRLHNTFFRWSKRQEYDEQNLNPGNNIQNCSQRQTFPHKILTKYLMTFQRYQYTSLGFFCR